MKFSELENKNIDELRQSLKVAQSELTTLKFELANKSLKDSNQIKHKKRFIARLLTMIGKIKYNNES